MRDTADVKRKEAIEELDPNDEIKDVDVEADVETDDDENLDDVVEDDDDDDDDEDGKPYDKPRDSGAIDTKGYLTNFELGEE